MKAGGAAAALASSRWFVPLVSTAAGADVVQLVALTDITFTELNKIQSGAGTPEDKQRAMAVLITQLIVVSGLTALSVQGARNARTLAGKPLEVVEQNGVKVLRVAGEDTPPPVGGSKAVADSPGPKSSARTDASGPSAGPRDPERWLTDLERSLDPAEKTKLAKMKSGKTPQQVRDMFGGDLEAARERVRAEVRIDQDRAVIAAQSKKRVAELRQQIADRGLMSDPDIHRIVVGTTAKNRSERIPMLRDNLVAKILRAEAEHTHPGGEVIDGIKVYEKLPEANVDEWKAKNPGKPTDGLTDRADGLYIQRGEIDMMVVERQTSGKAKVIAREEIKTGVRDTNASARAQLHNQTGLLRDGAAGKKAIRLEVGGRDITSEIDLGSDAAATKSTRGPAGKGFDKSLGVSASDLEALCKDLLTKEVVAGGGAP